MFENIGGKIKKFAQIMCWIGILASIVLGFVMTEASFNAYNSSTRSFLNVAGVVTMVLGSLLSWIGSMLIGGFGQLIEDTTAIRALLARDAQKENRDQTASTSVKAKETNEEAWRCKKCDTRNPESLEYCRCCGSLRSYVPLKPKAAVKEHENAATSESVASPLQGIEAAAQNLIKTMRTGRPIPPRKETVATNVGKTKSVADKSDQEWTCTKCGFVNTVANTSCTKCAHMRDSAAQPPKKTQLTDPSVPPRSAAADAGKAKEKEETKSPEWTCTKCGFVNTVANTSCTKCAHMRDSAAQPPKKTQLTDHSVPPRSAAADAGKAKEKEETKSLEWTCTKCGRMNSIANTSCSRCGNKREASRKNKPWVCEGCGTNNPASRVSCQKCGHTRDSAAQPPKKTQITDHSVPPRSAAADAGIAKEKEETKDPEWTCAKCGNVNTVANTSCTECGTKRNWLCEKCGMENPTNKVTCQKCGHTRGTASQDSRNTQYTQKSLPIQEAAANADKSQAETDKTNREWKCSACGRKNPISKETCPKCGNERDESAVTGVWVCKKCHTNNPVSRVSCQNCGNTR